MENEVLEKKETNETKSPKRSKKSIIMIVSTIVIFIGLIALAITVFQTPIKVSFSAPGRLGFNLPSEIVDENGKIKVPDSKKLEQKNYNFLGWFKNSDGSGDPLDLENMVFEKSTTVYAIWDVIEYKITYDYDGGVIQDLLIHPQVHHHHNHM